MSNSSISLNDNANAKANLQSSISLTPAAAAADVVVQSNGKKAIDEVSESKTHRRRARSLRNTFGWMRIEILTMLIAGIFLGAFCFSLIIEALQTLIHISHKDTMHYPVAIFTLAVGGLILNAFCYLLIGGYTHHQANFRRITPAGDVVLDQMANRNGLVRGSRRLSNDTKHSDCNQINVLTQSNGSSIQIDTQSAGARTKAAAAAAADQTTTAATAAMTTSSQNIPTPCITPQQKQTLIEFARDISSKLTMDLIWFSSFSFWKNSSTVDIFFGLFTQFRAHIFVNNSEAITITGTELKWNSFHSQTIQLQTKPANLNV